jgi:carbonic anhydrase/acetyltransferase-like protein (isoleucine patch superfamily)
MIASFAGKHPSIPTSAFIAPGAHIIGNVMLGENSSVWFGAVLRGDVNKITIGEFTNVQDGTVIHVTKGGHSTIIGARVTIGHKAILHACTVGNDCLIGMGSILLDGVEIGEGSVVAAGALVTPGKKFPPGSMILGSPAKLVRPLRPDERAEMIDYGWRNYRDLAAEYRVGYRVHP